MAENESSQPDITEGQHKNDINITELFADIQRFNRQHGLGRQMAEIMMHEIEPESQPDFKVSLEDLELLHGPTMRKIGIGLEKVPASGVILSSGDEGESIETRPYEIGINLTDGEKFISYLRSIDSIAITENQADGLKKIAESLTSQLTTEYSLEDADDARLLELFGNLQNIIQEYERLDNPNNNLGESIQELKKLLEIARNKYLREYLLATQFIRALQAEIGGRNFGPSQWHTDSRSETYETFWQKTLATLEQIRQNPAAADFYRQVVNHLSASLDYALEDLEKNEGEYTDSDEKITIAQKYRELLRDY